VQEVHFILEAGRFSRGQIIVCVFWCAYWYGRDCHKHSLDSILHQAHQQWRGTEPAAADALTSIRRRHVSVAILLRSTGRV
jgi:hypothetical protein